MGALVFLWLLATVSAIGVVYSTHETRKATQTLDALRREASGLKVMSGKYLLEKSSWSAYSRVENVAMKELNMQLPQPQDTVLISKETSKLKTNKYLSETSKH